MNSYGTLYFIGHDSLGNSKDKQNYSYQEDQRIKYHFILKKKFHFTANFFFRFSKKN